jgi:hypothetical protein
VTLVFSVDTFPCFSSLVSVEIFEHILTEEILGVRDNAQVFLTFYASLAMEVCDALNAETRESYGMANAIFAELVLDR